MGVILIPDTPGEVTLLLAEWKLGRPDALARLIPLVYPELRRLAAHYMRVTSALATPFSPRR